MTRRRMRVTLGTVALSVVLFAMNSAGSEDGAVVPGKERPSHWDEAALARLHSPPLGLPLVSIPENNPPTVEKIALGRKLFFDRRLSFNNTMSCAMCHIPEQGFTNNELSTPVGVGGRSLKRNAPTILNVAYARHVFLDGRETSLESQAITPLLAGNEMANPSAEWLVAKVAGLPDYQGLFENAFGGGPSIQRIGRAIASWERTLLAADSPFDRWRYGGDADALTPKQKRGFDLFVGKGRCHQCHSVDAHYALFTDQSFHDTGIGYLRDYNAGQLDSKVRVEVAAGVFVSVERQVVQKVGKARPIDLGRFEVTGNPEAIWQFKTPTLRNVALTAPYMHDGSLATLEAVVSFYNRGGAPHRGLDASIRPLGLNGDEIASLVAFLRSLTADNLTMLKADARSVAVGN